MKSSAGESQKISRTFSEKLKRLEPDESVRAVILPVISPDSAAVRGSTRATRRQAASKTIAAVMQAGFKQTDEQLAETGGQRLTDSPNKLGFIHIDAPAASIYALARQDWVKAILEDQPIRGT
jgi:hypothetical protein